MAALDVGAVLVGRGGKREGGGGGGGGFSVGIVLFIYEMDGNDKESPLPSRIKRGCRTSRQIMVTLIVKCPEKMNQKKFDD